MENTRATYSSKEKMEIVLSILSKKSNIQKIAKEKGIAATLISLWKRQALEAMEARFQPQPKGRRKSVPVPAPQVEAEVKVARNEARAAKIRAAHLETSLRETRAKLAAVQESLAPVATAFGCKLERVRKTRGPRKVSRG